MTRAERVMTALEGGRPDRVPVCPILGGATRQILGVTYRAWSTNAELCALALAKTVRRYRLDAAMFVIDLSVECAAWGQRLIYPREGTAHPDVHARALREPEDYARIRPASWLRAERMDMAVEVCRRLRLHLGPDIPIFPMVSSPLGVLTMLRGQTDLLTEVYDQLPAIIRAMEPITCTLEQYIRRLLDVGSDGILLDTLYASRSLISKELWSAVERPALAELAQSVRRQGRSLVLHNCGRDSYLKEQLASMHPQGISLQYPPEDCSNLVECRLRYRTVALMGCVDPVLALLAQPEEWEDVCRTQVRLLGRRGGYLLSTGCEYPPNAPLNLLRRMRRAADYEEERSVGRCGT